VDSFLDIYQASLNHYGEELCGDQVRVVKTPTATTIVLSDGLGSGVKANILATLTAEIIANLLRQQVELREVIDTVIRTLPVDPALGIAYATFSILTLDHEDETFRLINFDNPDPFFVCGGRIQRLPVETHELLGKSIRFSQGRLQMGDFLGLISDGVLYAGRGAAMNPGWDWDGVGAYLEAQFSGRVFTAHSVVNSVMAVTNRHYEFKPGDDATFVGVLRRQKQKLAVFTGPPLDTGFDYVPVERLLDFDGRKVICGGTTANIVAAFLKTSVETDMSTATSELPATGRLPGIDLVTEGILTLAAALEELDRCEGKLERLQPAHNGVYYLVRELLSADAITFLVGQSVNPAYRNPLLPRNVSIRTYLVERIAGRLEQANKDVTIEYY
jgi:hypothetical protein